MDYQAYLRSSEWRAKQEWALERAGHRCQVCDRPGCLEVHHRTYERLGAELPADLIVLDEDCHGLFRREGRLPRPPNTRTNPVNVLQQISATISLEGGRSVKRQTKKLPAIQFYPGDWRKDPCVQALDHFHKGVWIDLLCLMAESPRRGHLILPSGDPMPDDAIARNLGLDLDRWKEVRAALLLLGVASENDIGALYNRRIVRDEKVRAQKVRAGKKGGAASGVSRRSTKKDKDLRREAEPKQERMNSEADAQAKRGSSVAVAVSSSTSVKPPLPPSRQHRVRTDSPGSPIQTSSASLSSCPATRTPSLCSSGCATSAALPRQPPSCRPGFSTRTARRSRYLSRSCRGDGSRNAGAWSLLRCSSWPSRGNTSGAAERWSDSSVTPSARRSGGGARNAASLRTARF